MVDVSPKQLETIKRILAEHIGGREVRAFGSRVNGSAEECSDIDLAVVADDKMDRRTRMLLREAFEESDLPFRVDVIDYNAASDEFQAIVDANYEIVQKNSETSI